VKTIRECRERIDSIDAELIRLLDERMRVAEEIAEIKKAEGLPVEDRIRELEKLERVTDGSAPDMAGYNKMLWSSIMELSKDHQRQSAGEETPLIREIRKAIEETGNVFPETAAVACQGVRGAYSQEACGKFFKMPRIMFTRNFEGVFAAINSGLCRYGVLPLENSTAGSVNKVYDLMMKYDFHIVRSARVKINHCLLVNPCTRKEDIREVISHEQALAQCENYLKGFADTLITTAENTAAAAKYVTESGRRDIAAIGSAENGRLYGLECLDSGIQDSQNNYTRFICISKDLEIYPGACKTSIMMILDHKPGSLYNVLSRFNAAGINLEKLESRPLPNRDFEFMFYFDIGESVYSEGFVRVMAQLEEISREFKYLGSYSEV